MPSVLSHPAVSLGLLAAVGTKTIPARLGVVACVASVIPDVDVIGFKAGVPYGSFFGHRGFTHSLFFALLIAGVAAAFAGRLGASPWVLLGIVFVSAASHGILDAMTTGGMGVAFLSPFSNHRYFFPWRVIEVAPLGIGRFFSARGLTVLRSEFIWVWIP
ncbi:MAG: metal-dependent hydrolase, partial [bacterium]